jgi:hypothetical protein
LDSAGRALWFRVVELIQRWVAQDTKINTIDRDALALELFAWQRSRSPEIDRVARAFGGGGAIGRLEEIPGVPTDAFKSARIACFDPAHTERVFRTSGTTVGREVRGEHALADTSLYTLSAIAAGNRYLFRRPRYVFALLAERESDAPDSSLSFMLARFFEHFADDSLFDPWMIDQRVVALDRVRNALSRACRRGVPVALLGASFAFVHLCDALEPGERFALPPGSVAMPTGGLKGRVREI